MQLNLNAFGELKEETDHVLSFLIARNACQSYHPCLEVVRKQTTSLVVCPLFQDLPSAVYLQAERHTSNIKCKSVGRTAFIMISSYECQ